MFKVGDKVKLKDSEYCGEIFIIHEPNFSSAECCIEVRWNNRIIDGSMYDLHKESELELMQEKQQNLTVEQIEEFFRTSHMRMYCSSCGHFVIHDITSQVWARNRSLSKAVAEAKSKYDNYRKEFAEAMDSE